MTASISRMQFLRGDFRGRQSPIRPPWAVAEERFTAHCDRCGACMTRCPGRILRPGRGGFPEVAFNRGECDFCGACAEVCTRGAIAPSAEGPPWTLKARIGAGCLSLNGVVCRTCGEQCDARAITFHPLVGGAARPQIEPGACSGCGACFAPCPVHAIEISAHEVSA